MSQGEFHFSSLQADLTKARNDKTPELKKLRDNGFDWYFSIGRSKSNEFTEFSETNTVFVLNMDAFNNKNIMVRPINFYFDYKNPNKKLNTTDPKTGMVLNPVSLRNQRESEERVFSQVPSMKIKSAVIEIHSLIPYVYNAEKFGEYVKIVKQRGIPFYYYHDDAKSFKVINKKRAKRLA